MSEGFIGGIERRRREAAAAASASPEAAPETVGLTFAEIQATKSREWSAYLDSVGRTKTTTDLIQRLETGDTKPADLSAVEELVSGFNERTRTGEKLAATLDDYFETFIASSPDLKKLSVAYGATPLREALRAGIKELSYADPKHFGPFETHLKSLETLHDKEHAFDQKIGDFCAKHNLTSGELQTAFEQNPDMNDRERAIRLLMKHHMTGWERFVDSVKNVTVQGGSRSAALGMASQRHQIEDIISQKEGFLKDAGSSIAALMSTNPAFRNALLNARVGETPEIKGIVDKHTTREEANEAAQIDWENFDRVAADYKKRTMSDWDSLTPTQRSERFEGFYKTYEREHFAKKIGFGLMFAVAKFLFGFNNKTEMKKRFFADKKDKDHE